MPDKFKYSESNFRTGGSILGSKFHHMLRTAPDKSVFIIPLQYQYRIDLIANALYGDSRMAWVLNATNSILNVEALAHDRTLYFLTRNEIDKLYTKWRHSK